MEIYLDRGLTELVAYDLFEFAASEAEFYGVLRAQCGVSTQTR